MTTTEIKKQLYRENLDAHFVHVRKNHVRYKCQSTYPEYWEVDFIIPFSDIGDATFEALMPAKHLIRYLVNPEPTTQP